MIEPLLVAVTFLTGLLFRQIGLPPLLGYLVAGFIAGSTQVGDAAQVQALADLGIILLLFTIGLKLDIRQLAAPMVWGSTLLHTAAVVPLTALMLSVLHFFIPGMNQIDSGAAWMMAFALSFSSTVFAVKIFDQRGESAALHARICIGILVMQDLIAVLYLVFTADYLPSVWAFGLLLLPLFRAPIYWLLRQAGHGELLVLFGLGTALAGAWLFEALHLKAGLGALCFGALISGGDKGNELYKSLGPIKDLLLTAFFLSIGYYGLPTGQMLLVALALGVLITLRPLIYFFLLIFFRLRARTALLSGFALFNYSEFGLIVAALAAQAGVLQPEWLTTLAVATALSLFVSAPFNTRVHNIYTRYSPLLQRFERESLLPIERSADLGSAEVLVFGMGRIGSGAYQVLQQHYPGQVMGVEEAEEKAIHLRESGMRCQSGDVSDRDFLERAQLSKRRLILVCLTNHGENVAVAKLLQRLGFAGQIAVVSRFPDQEQELREMGCISFNLYAEAGHGFAEHVVEELAAAT